MRALLIVNPSATTTSEGRRDLLARALRSEVDLEIVSTTRRGHAAELASRAVQDVVDLVVSLGGDGTVNEVVNGLLAGGPSEKTPALAVVPGGSTNVFARAVGLPHDPVDATAAILEALRLGRSRTVGLGCADGRWFTFSAGLGLDGEVVRRVEAARLQGRTATPGLYVRSTVAQWARTAARREPLITLRRDDGPPVDGLSLVIVQNTAPWTYLGARAVHPSPAASFDTGLDVTALGTLGLASTLRTAAEMLVGARGPHGRGVVRLPDLAGFTLTARRPSALQVDGDYVGEHDEVTFRAVPAALRLIV